MNAERIDPIPEAIDSPRAKLVYLYLEAVGRASIDELGTVLVMKKITLLSVLQSLMSDGLVEKRGDEYVAAT